MWPRGAGGRCAHSVSCNETLCLACPVSAAAGTLLRYFDRCGVSTVDVASVVSQFSLSESEMVPRARLRGRSAEPEAAGEQVPVIVKQETHHKTRVPRARTPENLPKCKDGLQLFTQRPTASSTDYAVADKARQALKLIK